MKGETAQRKLAGEWVRYAADDLRAAKFLFEAGEQAPTSAQAAGRKSPRRSAKGHGSRRTGSKYGPRTSGIAAFQEARSADFFRN